MRPGGGLLTEKLLYTLCIIAIVSVVVVIVRLMKILSMLRAKFISRQNSEKAEQTTCRLCENVR